MEYLITVTRKHIDTGRIWTSHAGPVALALKEVFPDAVCVAGVQRGTLTFNTCTSRTIVPFNIPIHVSDFIEKYDSDRIPRSKLKPFEFLLEINIPESK